MKTTRNIFQMLIFSALLSSLLMTHQQSEGGTMGSILYVKADATGECSSWADACGLQYALGIAVSGDEIWVVAGTHYPAEIIDRYAYFNLKSGVALYAGFLGIETRREQRDWIYNQTILSGDLDRDDILDDSNAYQVVVANSVDESLILDGFTISMGNANGATPFNQGGGMYNNHSSLTLTNVTFLDNNASNSGGGMYNHASSPNLDNLIFVHNTAGVSGGGMYNYFSNPSLSMITFVENSAGESGGGLYNYASNHTLTDIIFYGNKAGIYGGGMYNDASESMLTNINFLENFAGESGGGMYNINLPSPILINCSFTGNSAEAYHGGGMYNYNASPYLTNCSFTGNSADEIGGGMYNAGASNPAVSNATFLGNSAAMGAGMGNESSTPRLINCTFSDNTAILGGGGMLNIASFPILRNCILWEDSPNEIFNYDVRSSPVVTYSDIQGGHTGDGNINVNPCFVDALLGNLHLQPNSPAIDAGNNDAVLPGVTTDLDGLPRFVDILDMPDSGFGDAPIVDMGAYEVQRIRLCLPFVVK